MTQKNAKNAQSFGAQKVQFPKRPWEKKKTEEKPVEPETPVPEEKKPTPAPKPEKTSETAQENVNPKAPSEAVPETEEKKPEASQKKAPEPEKPKSDDINLSAIADAYLAAQAELKKLKDELEKTRDAYLHAVADFDNYRRRTNEERPKNMIYAKGDLAKDVFPVLDNFKLGLEAAEKQHPEAKTILEGFAMIASQLKNALAGHGIVEIDPAGKAFDPQEHESLSMMPSADVPADHVLFVQRVGYKIGDRLLRPASVVISAGEKA